MLNEDADNEGKSTMEIREYIKENKLLFDGAFGTYYTLKGFAVQLPEMANVTCPDMVKQIHREYIEAGAGVIRTNTFAAGRTALSCTEAEQKEILTKAAGLAREAAQESGRQVWIAGDIGPVSKVNPTEDLSFEEYLFMARTLREAGADFLLFETFPDYEEILPVIRVLKKEKPELFIQVQFSVNQYGYTASGISIRRIFRTLSEVPEIDALGLNCGLGPGHMLKIYSTLALSPDKLYSALPNASYPKLIQDRMVFLENKEYFIEKLKGLSELGIDFLGGCCGTTPEYIRGAFEGLTLRQSARKQQETKPVRMLPNRSSTHGFYQQKAEGEKLIAVELAPPFKADDEKVMEAAYALKNQNVDAVTFPDSPSGRTRADSILMGVKTMDKTGLCTMPHICCRDKNAIAIRSQLLGAYMNGIRNLLVITGDPVPLLLRNSVKSVYNFDSVGFMRIIGEMNEEEFAEDPMVYGGALNPSRPNLTVEIERAKKKAEAGATFFLTQPLFTGGDILRLKQIREQLDIRILCGIMPLVSKKNALFIQNEMAGIHVTDEVTARYDKAQSREEGEAVGVAIAKEVMSQTADFVDGYYFSIPFNRVYLLEQILKQDVKAL